MCRRSVAQVNIFELNAAMRWPTTIWVLLLNSRLRLILLHHIQKLKAFLDVQKPLVELIKIMASVRYRLANPNNFWQNHGHDDRVLVVEAKQANDTNENGYQGTKHASVHGVPSHTGHNRPSDVKTVVIVFQFLAHAELQCSERPNCRSSLTHLTLVTTNRFNLLISNCVRVVIELKHLRTYDCHDTDDEEYVDQV